MFCKKCGNEVDENTSYCPKCGDKQTETVNGEEEVQSDPVQSTTSCLGLIVGLVAIGLGLFAFMSTCS